MAVELTTLAQLKKLSQRTDANIKSAVQKLEEKIPTEETITTLAEAAALKTSHLSRKKVASVDDIDPTAADAEKYIYMVPKADGTDNDVYDEYIVEDGKREKLGDTAVNLEGYLSEADIASDEAVDSMLDEIFGPEETETI